MSDTPTKRDRFLAALRNEPFDKLTWAPNFDYWLNVNSRRGTVPPEFAGMSRDDIVRAIGGTIWCRGRSVRIRYQSEVDREQTGENSWRETIHTSAGDLTQQYVVQGGEDNATVLHEHPVKTVDDLPKLVAHIRAATLEVNDTARENRDSVGEDGVVLDTVDGVPFIRFGKLDAGWETGLLMWFDAPDAVEEVLAAYEELYLEQIRLMCEHSPADIVWLGDNMDQLMVSPDLFARYAAPFYEKVAAITEPAGKNLQVHWCGRTNKLLGLLPGTGVEVVEAVVTEPMTDLTVEAALEKLAGKVVMQGGIPAVTVCKEGGTREDFERRLRHITDEVHPTRGFVLGMGDNVPPNADFERVKTVAKIVEEAYG